METYTIEDSGQNFNLFSMFCLQGFLGERQDYLLFASLFEITMMDPSVGTRPITFELSIGKQSVLRAGCGCRELTDTWLACAS